MSKIYELNKEISQNYDLAKSYDTLLALGRDKFKAESGAVYYQSKEELYLEERYNLDSKFMAKSIEVNEEIFNLNDSISIIANLNNYKDNILTKDFNSAIIIKFKNEKNKFLIFLSTEKNYFTNKDRKIAKLIRGQIPLIINKGCKLKKLEKNIAELSILQKTSNTINSTLNLEEVFDLTVDVIMGTMGVSITGLFILNDNFKLDLVSYSGIDKEKDELLLQKTKKICWEAINEKKWIVKDEVENIDFKSLGIKSGMIVPLKIRDKILGVVAIGQTSFKREFETNDKRFINTLSNQIAIGIENARMYQQMEELATKDGLTGLYTHSHFQELLQNEIEKANRYSRQVSLLMLDIDNFKNFNDTFGHQVGDKILQKLSKLLKHKTRQSDIVARYGGEEFAIILPETNVEGGKLLGERLNQSIRNMKVKYDDLNLSITVSIGVSQYQNGESQKEFIKKTDEMLYKAKETGKDKTCFYPDLDTLKEERG